MGNMTWRQCVFTCRAAGFLLVLACLVASCKPTVPDKYIQPKDMEDILYDYYITQALAGQGQGREAISYNKNMYYHAVLKKHGVTEADFDSSLVYYYLNADRLYDIYVHLSERIGNEAMTLGASVGEFSKYSNLSADGDTADIWHESTSLVLMPIPPYDKLTFAIKADSTFKRGDSFLLNFKSDFMYQAGTKDAVVYVAVHYGNDSVSTHVNRVGVSGISQLRIPGDKNNDIKNIDGFIYLSRGNDDSQTLKLMFISQIQFVRFHAIKPVESETNGDSAVVKRDTLKVASGPSVGKGADTVANGTKLMRYNPVRRR